MRLITGLLVLIVICSLAAVVPFASAQAADGYPFYDLNMRAGPGSAVPQPEIPLCWPQSVAVGDDAVHVGDRLNRRIVRVRLEYSAEETIPAGP